MMKKLFSICCLFCVAVSFVLFVSGCSGERSYSEKSDKLESSARRIDEDDRELPNVMLIGDSICGGYKGTVQNLLTGRANVYHRFRTKKEVRHGGPTTVGLRYFDDWLGDKKWDVIHFNWGLHDMKYVDESGKRVCPEKGKPQVPIEQYEKKLQELVKRMKKTGAVLICATTTPVPEGAFGRIAGDAKKYNEVAEKIMNENNIIINDLYSFALPRLNEIQKRRNVHFTENGYRLLGEQVASSIRKALEGKNY